MKEKIKNIYQQIASRGIVRDVSWYTFANFSSTLFGFIGVLFVSRYLGPVNLGLYSFAINYASVFFTIAGGCDLYFTWQIARSTDVYRDIKEYIVYRLYLFAVVFSISSVSALIILPKDVAILIIVFMLPTVIYSFSAFSFYALSVKYARLTSIVHVLSNLVFLLLKIVLVLVSAKLIVFVAVASFESVLGTSAVAIYFLREKSWRAKLAEIKAPTFLSLFSFLYKLKTSIFVTVFWQLLLRADQLFLATVSNAYSLGVYAAAVKIAEIPNIFAGILYTAMIGRMASIIDSDNSYKNNNLRRLLFIYIGLGCIFAIGVTIFAPLLVHIIFGNKFQDSIHVLRMYALSLPGFYMLYFFYLFFGAANKYVTQSLVFLSSVVINVLLVLLLTPLYGLTGTAVATVFAYTSGGILFYIYWRMQK